MQKKELEDLVSRWKALRKQRDKLATAEQTEQVQRKDSVITRQMDRIQISIESAGHDFHALL